jgi:hypothetical protein
MSNFDSTPRSSLRLFFESCISDSIDEGPAKESPEQPSSDREFIVKFVPSDRQQRELDRLSGVAKPKTVDLTVGQIVPLLIHAMENDRTWLKDFAQDTVRIDADLYDVLLAYQQIIDRKVA